MTRRAHFDFPLLALSLGAALAGCSGGTPSPSTAAAPAQPDTVQAQATAPAPGATAADSAGHTGTAHPAGADPMPAAEAADSFLTFDSATNTVTFRLVAGPFEFNGYTSGGATLAVPPGSNVVINFEQNDGTPHSAEVATGTGPVPNSGGEAAIPRAYTNKLIEGLPQGATDVMRFTAPDSGTYRLICGVPGHALSGMWLWFKVDPAAKTPSFGPSKQS